MSGAGNSLGWQVVVRKVLRGGQLRSAPVPTRTQCSALTRTCGGRLETPKTGSGGTRVAEFGPAAAHAKGQQSPENAQDGTGTATAVLPSTLMQQALTGKKHRMNLLDENEFTSAKMTLQNHHTSCRST